eukprot:gb/GECH01006481.1/.p1 GENE.gb/GECH01006481.1/~~gb/GECH01006481.1/.p1  ORF type:complete len:425 (+),score=99.91 gb/GECH01006481.1/:1-1275(+)
MPTRYHPSSKLSSNRVTAASQLMDAFAQRMGLSPTPSHQPPRRYLWTDAFAVSNFIALYRETGEERYRSMATDLVSSVHDVLGRHRHDWMSSGQWLSGLGEQEGQNHPTQGGLRIGKPHPDTPGHGFEPEASEWDRDGQYFHYITRWMHALDLMGRVTSHPSSYHRWAIELGKTAHRSFVYKPAFSPQPRMYWKMNVDLTQPMVTSQGHHDPLDGYISLLELSHGTSQDSHNHCFRLDDELETFRWMCQDHSWSTSDPLGIGCLLTDSYRLYQHLQEAPSSFSSTKDFDHDLLKQMIRDANRSLETEFSFRQFELPSEVRLAFRELGLAIGLQAVAKMAQKEDDAPKTKKLFAHDSQSRETLQRLARFVPRSEQLIEFWRHSKPRSVDTWIEHQDINDVMLATALIPSGFLDLPQSKDVQKGEH